MKPIIRIVVSALLTVLPFVSSKSQTTYSKEEERMAQFVNNGLAFALKYDSLQRLGPVLDSCRRFLTRYPNSFVKPNVFSYMLEMTVLISNDKKTIYELIDSVLRYDRMPTTKMRIGELLIERDIDSRLGKTFLENAFPHLSVTYHRYKTHLLLARVAINEGLFATAKDHLTSALSLDSTRLDGWYEYLGYSQLSEQPNEASYILRKISEINNKQLNQYIEYVSGNPYVGKSVSHLNLRDLDSNLVSFGIFENKVIVLQLFNFWCGTPEKQFPALKHLIKEFPGVAFVFLNAGETSEELRMRYFTKSSSQFLKDQTIVFPDTSAIRLFGGVFQMGEILLVDKQGKIRFSFPGMTKNLEQMIRKRLLELLRVH